MRKYVSTSLETHLFFGRIMKEHALFLQAAFPTGEQGYRSRANHLRQQFEEFLEQTVRITNGMVSDDVLRSDELVTEFTEMAERQTRMLTKIPINIRITQAEKNLRATFGKEPSEEMVRQVRRMNQRALSLLDQLIAFKEQILREVLSCNLYTANYPLLIEHILREAKLYREIITELEKKGSITSKSMKETEMFWNRIMMEHAQFIRGLLDPTEEELMETANDFAEEYRRLLEEAKHQDCRAMEGMTESALKLTEQYRDFKTAGTEGITECNIRSVILPLLADHVLREANHYLRILKQAEEVW